ncbi:MAG: LPS assembly protein LptD [Alphaproteobacteria bacterium]|nr:LPS assembly protein LptD [Alphaproteobacteria bacterium]
MRVGRGTAACRGFWYAAVMLVSLGAIASGPVRAQEQESRNVLIEAPQVEYNTKDSIVTASGGVEVSTGGRVLRSDTLIFNQRTGIVTASGNVSITELDGTVAFADDVTLSDDLKDGVVNSFSMLLADDSKLAATQGRRSGGTVSELDNVVFSPCKVCKDPNGPPPVWQIKARRVIHDKNAQTISYEDARFEFLGVDVVYLPYFAHADPSVRRKSGFLVPSFGSSTDLGYFLEVPYYWAPAPNYDFTISPFVTTDEGQVLKGEYRHRFEKGYMRFSGSVANVEQFNTDGTGIGENTVASHLFGEGGFELAEHWNWGFKTQLTSSDTYMERYEISGEDRLESTAFVEGRWNRSSVMSSGFYFQGLRETDDVGTTPFVLPLVEATYFPRQTLLGGRFRLDGNLMLLQRTNGPDSRRVSASAEWRRETIAETGEVFTFFASMRGDVYQTNDLNPLALPGVRDDDVIGRFLPMVGAEYRWPWTRPVGNTSVVVEPIVQLIAAPYGGNPSEIPNEDSASFEFDDTNLFSAVKFPGLDRWESGVRANVGVRASAYFDNGGLAEVLLGQNFRLEEDDAFSFASGLGDQESDYVGRIFIEPTENFSLTHRFRLAKEDLSFQRNEIELQGRYDRLSGGVGYTLLGDDTSGLGLLAREEVRASARFNFAPFWFVQASGRRDLENDQMIESRAGIGYEDECSAFSLIFARRFTEDRDAEPSTAILFNIRLKALGEEVGS